MFSILNSPIMTRGRSYRVPGGIRCSFSAVPAPSMAYHNNSLSCTPAPSLFAPTFALLRAQNQYQLYKTAPYRSGRSFTRPQQPQ
ncbi:hypothetical protein AG1IA_01938 [Rhizoctonia solani AG-1 IA]|uniref:Uncharacterized protein n=1 Tax=Thanatephorus cucumeris (strain AG1-IA) TaxID=983506 RepID=L8X4I4_THACA|nr:hypothetical protein AG1IA_01938 [Rhizoctonia solani AG-1 IA]